MIRFKILRFIERYSLSIIKYIFLSIVILVFFLELMDREVLPYSYFSKLNELNNEYSSGAITLATVFVGIYFSIYGMIISSPEKSTYQRLNSINKKALIKILNNSFFSSMILIILTFFQNILMDYLPSSYLISIFLLYLFVFYSAILFGLVISILIKSDIEDTIY